MGSICTLCFQGPPDTPLQKQGAQYSDRKFYGNIIKQDQKETKSNTNNKIKNDTHNEDSLMPDKNYNRPLSQVLKQNNRSSNSRRSSLSLAHGNRSSATYFKDIEELQIIEPQSPLPFKYYPTRQEQQVAQIFLQKGEEQIKKGDYRLASKFYEEALQILKDEKYSKQYGMDDIYKIKEDICLDLIEIQKKMGRKQRIHLNYKRCLNIYNQQPEFMIFEKYIIVLNNYSLFLREQHQLVQAINHARKAVSLSEKYYTHCSPLKFTVLTNLACYYTQNQQQKEANIIYAIIEKCKDTTVAKIALNNQKYSSSTNLMK